MNAMERRSVQQKGWLGFAVLAGLPMIGVLMLSASLSLFLVALLISLLCGAFAVGLPCYPRNCGQRDSIAILCSRIGG